MSHRACLALGANTHAITSDQLLWDAWPAYGTVDISAWVDNHIAEPQREKTPSKRLQCQIPPASRPDPDPRRFAERSFDHCLSDFQSSYACLCHQVFKKTCVLSSCQPGVGIFQDLFGIGQNLIQHKCQHTDTHAPTHTGNAY